jgi:hypothetical protein
MRTHQWNHHLCVPLQNPIIIFSSFSHHFLIIFSSFSHHFLIMFSSFSHHFLIIFSSFSHHFLHDLVILGNPLFVTKRYFEPGVKRNITGFRASLRPISPCRGPGWGRRLHEDVQEGMETGHH